MVVWDHRNLAQGNTCTASRYRISPGCSNGGVGFPRGRTGWTRGLVRRAVLVRINPVSRRRGRKVYIFAASTAKKYTLLRLAPR